MAYCAQSDIEADFKGISFASSGTAISTTQLAEFITQESYYIDARIGLRYATPVVAASYPEAYSILKRICVFRVSERVRNVIEVKSNASQKNEADEKYSKNRIRTPNDDLDLIVKGLLVLKDVPLLSTNNGLNSFNVDEGISPTFKVNKQQW